MITILRDNENYNTIYGVIISDDYNNINEEIKNVLNDQEFIEDFTDEDGIPCWCVDDVLEKLSHEICFEFEYNYEEAYI